MFKYKLISGLLLCCVLSGCTDDSATRKALKNMGFKDIETHGHAWFSCSKDDGTCTKFSATNQNGRKVSGAVGCGYFFKNCTVRFS